MPPHLHPRSRFTTSLFGTTLLVSFLVVGMPHILPCPAPRVEFADAEFEYSEDGRRRRRRRRPPEPVADVSGGDESFGGVEEEEALDARDEMELRRKKAHECPVPKPGGVIGEVLGFRKAREEERPRIETTLLDRQRKNGEGT